VVFPAPRKPDKTVTGSFGIEIKEPVKGAEPGTIGHRSSI
jgi:hypothetical protein